jgi:DNA processing protein
VHRLLREGAALVEEPGEVLEALGVEERPAPAPAAEAGPAGAPDRLLALLGGSDPLDADELAAASGLPARTVRAALVDLEIDGRVRVFPGGRYAKAL